MMKNELISVSILETTSATGAIISFIEQVEPILRFIAAAIAIVSGLVSIILMIVKRGKKAAEDGKITMDEVVEIAQEANEQLKEVEKKVEDAQKDWAERKD